MERRLADVAVRRGEWDDAAAGLDAARRLAGDDPALRARLLADRAVVAVRAGQLPTARSVAAEALASSGSPDAYLHNVAGIVALADGAPDDALEQFSLALAAEPDPCSGRGRQQPGPGGRGGGRREDAVVAARDALVLGERIGDRHRLAALHANLADRLHETRGPR